MISDLKEKVIELEHTSARLDLIFVEVIDILI